MFHFQLDKSSLQRKKTYPFTVNPFNAVAYDEFLERNTAELLTTTNQNVIMDKADI